MSAGRVVPPKFKKALIAKPLWVKKAPKLLKLEL